MTIETQNDRRGIERIGKIVGETIGLMRKSIEPGMTTAELDHIAADYLATYGARSAPMLRKNFPGTTCISVNEEAVHGIPSNRVLKAGDMVTVDVTAELDGYIADSAFTILIAPSTPLQRRLRDCTKTAFKRALNVAKAGQPINLIGKTIEREVRRYGFSVMIELCSHGVGRDIHEPPNIPSYFDKRLTEKLTDGMVITIEPIISATTNWSRELDDGWTICSRDGSLTSHYEHTIIITQGRPIIVTALN